MLTKHSQSDNIIVFNDELFYASEIELMRMWLIDASVYDEITCEELTNHEVLASIRKYYGGGFTQFAIDNSITLTI